jgi:hypothetical protein
MNRRSRRLAGLEPEEISLSSLPESTKVYAPAATTSTKSANLCLSLFGAVGTVLASYTLTRATFALFL